ncbi:MAG: hypothetical protein AB7S81_01155 [Bdellovibrionales bacterium]
MIRDLFKELFIKFCSLFQMIAALVLLFIIGGPLLLGTGVAAYYYFIKRGERFIRAYCYLMMVGTGETVEVANITTHFIPTHALAEFSLAAKQYAKAHYNNNRMLLVQHAKQLGFQPHK